MYRADMRHNTLKNRGRVAVREQVDVGAWCGGIQGERA